MTDNESIIDVKNNNDNDVFCKPELPQASVVVTQSQKQSSKQHQTEQKIDYNEPIWSSIPNDNYFLECIKNGTQLENIDISKKSLYSIGRYYNCDLMLEHPSLSRFHAILQYSNGELDVNYPKGFYLFDLNSTHGTFVNKQKIEAKKYIYLKIGSCIKFGGSTRLYILNGPELPNADDLNINLTHEQMRKLRDKQNKLALKIRIQKEIEEEEANKNDDNDNDGESGCDWGLNNDVDSNNEAKNGDAAVLKNVTFNSDQSTDDNYYAADPKKALKIFFDREGDELNYECEELGYGRFKCRIRLPIDNDLGEAVYAEVANFEGKKKECMSQCALEACRILDSVGILRQSSSELKRKRIEKDWQSNDYYDSDDDTYLDRTGDIEKKRLKRIEKLTNENDGDLNKNVITFDLLQKDFKNLNEELIDINMKLEKCKNIMNAVQNDDIDAYINLLKQRDNNQLDTITRTKYKRRTIDISHELIKIDKLLKLAKPCGFDLDKWKFELVEELKKSKLNNNDKKEEEKVIVKQQDVKVNVVYKQPEVKIDKKPIIENKVVKITKQQPSIIPKQKEALLEAIDLEENSKDSNKNKNYNDFANDKDYAVWMPPENQTGDGKTKLNEKYGY